MIVTMTKKHDCGYKLDDDSFAGQGRHRGSIDTKVINTLMYCYSSSAKPLMHEMKTSNENFFL